MVPLTIVSLLFGAAASAAGLLAADRMHLMVAITSAASVSEVMLPIGHWAFTAMWMAVIAVLARDGRRDAMYRCLGVALALHVVVLVTLFVAKLSDREAFSARAYLIYAQVFCMTTLAAAIGWS